MDSNSGLNPELAVIGCMVTEPELSGRILETVREEDFGDPALRTIFAAAKTVFLSGRPTDPVLVRDAAGQAYVPYLREAIMNTPTTAYWKQYVHDLREAGALRRMNAAGLRVATAATAQEAREALAEAEGLVTDRPDLRISTLQESMLDFRRRVTSEEKPDYLPWPWQNLRKKLRAELGDFLIIGADSSVGKTAMALQMAWHISMTGKRVGFFSLETSIRKLADRIAAQMAGIDMQRIKDRTMTAEDFRFLGEISDMSQKMNMELIEAAGYSVADVRSVTLSRRYQVIFCDYVQLLSAPGKDRWEVVTSVSMDLHRLAQELGVAVIGLSQITPPDKKTKKAPDKDSLRESRQLKQDADAIMMLSLAKPDAPDSPRSLEIVKNKDGPLGQMYLRFSPAQMSFDQMGAWDWKEWQKGHQDDEDEPTPFDGEDMRR